MNRKFTNPYIVFYPTVSRDGMPFPTNKCIREIQGRAYKEEISWRGNIVVAKYRDSPFTSLMDATMADFPILKNFLLTHGSPVRVSVHTPNIPTRHRRLIAFTSRDLLGIATARVWIQPFEYWQSKRIAASCSCHISKLLFLNHSTRVDMPGSKD